MKLKAMSFYRGLVDTGHVVWDKDRYAPCGDNGDLVPEASHEVAELELERLAVLKLLTETTHIKDIGYTYKYAENDFAYVVIREHQE